MTNVCYSLTGVSMAMQGSSDKVRKVASARYVEPRRQAGDSRFSIAVSDISKDLAREHFPPNHTPQICSALRSKKLLKAEGLELERVDGPPSGQSTTVVFHYRFVEPPTATQGAGSNAGPGPLERLRGVMKGAFDEDGGGEAFLRSLRYDSERDGSGHSG
jgi:hypothetical protein